MSRWRISKVRISAATVVWITVLWVLLWGEFSVGNVLAGAVIGLAVQAFLPLPRVGYHGKVRPRWVVRLVARFAIDLVVASFQVALLALNPTHRPHGAVIKVQLRSESDLYLAFVAELSTLVPGSVVVEALRGNGRLYIHVLDVEALGGIEKVRAHVLAVEERVLWAIASDDELRSAGLIGGAS